MTQSELNRAVSRATGEDFDVIESRGFSLLDEDGEISQPEDDLEALIVDWDRIQPEQATAVFRDRQTPNAA